MMLGGAPSDFEAGSAEFVIAKVLKDGSLDDEFGDGGVADLTFPGLSTATFLVDAIWYPGETSQRYRLAVLGQELDPSVAYRPIIAIVTTDGMIDETKVGVGAPAGFLRIPNATSEFPVGLTYFQNSFFILERRLGQGTVQGTYRIGQFNVSDQPSWVGWRGQTLYTLPTVPMEPLVTPKGEILFFVRGRVSQNSRDETVTIRFSPGTSAYQNITPRPFWTRDTATHAPQVLSVHPVSGGALVTGLRDIPTFGEPIPDPFLMELVWN
jgi:hypothetical protein